MENRKPNMDRIHEIHREVSEMDDKRHELLAEGYKHFHWEKIRCHSRTDDDRCEHWLEEDAPKNIVLPGCSFHICPYIHEEDTEEVKNEEKETKHGENP